MALALAASHRSGRQGPSPRRKADAPRMCPCACALQLSHADIQAMKAAGAGGEAIVAALTSNSSTFEGKTKFSQEKYK